MSFLLLVWYQCQVLISPFYDHGLSFPVKNVGIEQALADATAKKSSGHQCVWIREGVFRGEFLLPRPPASWARQLPVECFEGSGLWLELVLKPLDGASSNFGVERDEGHEASVDRAA